MENFEEAGEEFFWGGQIFQNQARVELIIVTEKLIVRVIMIQK